MYHKKKAKNGRTLYYKDARLCSKREFEENYQEPASFQSIKKTAETGDDTLVLTNLNETGPQVAPVSPPAEQTVEAPVKIQVELKPERICIFCGAFGKIERFINRQTIYLCTNDYQAKTIGEIAEQMRKINGRTS